MCHVIGDDEYETASEGEGRCVPIVKQGVESTVKVAVKFFLPKVSVQVLSENTSIELTMSSLNMNCQIMSWNTKLSLSLSSVELLHFILERETPIKVLSTVGDEDLLRINLVQVSICVIGC